LSASGTTFSTSSLMLFNAGANFHLIAESSQQSSC
jgi:hypothetical protein